MHTVTAGPFQPIYDPSPAPHEPWYINDHAFALGPDNLWHLFGITHPEPANPLEEKHFAHATAPHPLGPWTRQPHALSASPQHHETHLWAPHITRHNGLYHMVYCAGGNDHHRYRIHLATSPDLGSWTRHPANPLITDGFDARDPMVVRDDARDRWLLYYTANEHPQGGRHAVLAAESTDLLHWKHRHTVFLDHRSGTFGGPCESPFVLHHKDAWYLFVGPRQLGEPDEDSYNTTGVYRSLDPLHFTEDNRVGMIPAHAAEILYHDNRCYISHAGWGQAGVHLAELHLP